MGKKPTPEHVYTLLSKVYVPAPENHHHHPKAVVNCRIAPSTFDLDA
ncbi:unnamed protein product, partial [marine sediment metagenome]